MDNSIRVTWSGGERTFTPGTVVRFGREPGSEVELANSNVSRQHAQLEFVAGSWTIRDLGSAQGCWQGTRRIDSLTLDGTTQLTLGQAGRGEDIVLITAGVDGTQIGAAPAPERTAAGSPPPNLEGTVVVGASPDRPGGPLREDGPAPATVVTGDVINVECGGRTYSFHPGQVITIGREATCDIVSANPTVSRHHATLRHDGQSWLIEDAGSSSGTFVDGARISTLRLGGSTATFLGAEETGERIVLVTSGAHQAPPGARRKSSGSGANLVIAVVAVMALVIAGVAFFLVRNSGPDNDELARGTVQITATGKTDTGTGYTLTGSGTIIDSDRGLILTNSHVAKPDNAGLDPEKLDDGSKLLNPDLIVISITPGLDKNAEPTYVAEVAAADGYVDLAVVRITKTIGGRLLGRGEFGDLVQIERGDSDAVVTGDSTSVVGFPAAAQSSSATLTTGVISGLVGDDALGTNRAFFNISAPISSGNSGGLAANSDGEIIGVPTLVRGGSVGSIRPVKLAEGVIDAATKGEDYHSPYAKGG